MAQVTLGGTPVNTNGNLPANGSSLNANDLVKADLSTTNVGDFKGKKVILNIFPSVDTSTCATSVRKFNEQAAGLDNTVVICVSKDLPFAQARFCGAEGIENVTVVSDFRSAAFSEELGVLLVDGPFQGLDARAIVVLNEEGNVTHTELVTEIADEPNYEAALAAL